MLPFVSPMFAASGVVDLSAMAVTTDRSAGGTRAFPSGVVAGDLAIAFVGAQTALAVQSAGLNWLNIGNSTVAKSRLITAADLASGYSTGGDCILVFYRGARSAALLAGEDAGQGATRSLGGFTRSASHAGLVTVLYGAGPLNSPEIGVPISPAPFNLRREGGYNTASTTFTTAIVDRLTPLYVNGTDVTWSPSASNGNGIQLIELIA